MNELISYNVSDRIAYITLNRPEKRNALGPQLVAELTAAFKQAEADPTAKVIVLKANGKVFSAGADLAYLQQLQENTYQENLDDSNHLKTLFQTIYLLDKVVIAQVEGHAIAGGCGLASVCDIVFSVPEANYGYTEVRIGFVPALVACFLLRKIGETKAKEILLSGKLFDADKALQYGLINFVVAASQIENEVNKYAKELCNETSASSLKLTKELIANVQEMTLETGLSFAANMNAKARGTDDCKKGISAFLNKETINW